MRLLAACVWLLSVAGLFAACGVNTQEAQRATTHLVMIVDGLRPDYVTTELMPRLTSLGQRGVVFQAHHSVFPTVTRVNSSSITTGAYPETHGLMGNSIYIPRADATAPLDTADRENLEAVAKADGPLLRAPSLGQILQKSGRTVLVASAGSSGSAFLLSPVAGIGTIINTDFILPSEFMPASPNESERRRPRRRRTLHVTATPSTRT